MIKRIILNRPKDEITIEEFIISGDTDGVYAVWESMIFELKRRPDGWTFLNIGRHSSYLSSSDGTIHDTILQAFDGGSPCQIYKTESLSELAEIIEMVEEGK